MDNLGHAVEARYKDIPGVPSWNEHIVRVMSCLGDRLRCLD